MREILQIGIRPLCVDVNEVAALLGVSPMTVRRLDGSGELPSKRIRGRKVWLVQQIHDYLGLDSSDVDLRSQEGK